MAALSPNPGATLATTLNVKPPASAAAGTYSILPTSTNTAAVSYVSAATATYVVAIPGGDPGVPVTSSDDFARGDSASIGNGWAEAQGDFSVTGGKLRSGPTRALHKAVLSAVAGSNQCVAARFASTDNNHTARASG